MFLCMTQGVALYIWTWQVFLKIHQNVTSIMIVLTALTCADLIEEESKQKQT